MVDKFRTIAVCTIRARWLHCNLHRVCDLFPTTVQATTYLAARYALVLPPRLPTPFTITDHFIVVDLSSRLTRVRQIFLFAFATLFENLKQQWASTLHSWPKETVSQIANCVL